jgi:acyl-coenzyme A thioesterase PaaI-like protein
MHALVASEPDAATMTTIAESLATGIDLLEAAPPRASHFSPGPPADQVPADGEAFPPSSDRPVSGVGNPFSIPMTMFRDGDEVVSTVTLGAAFQGAPGRSHGGLVAAIFDDLFGSLPMLENKIAFTASLTVNYVAPSPVFQPVEFRGRINRVEGKKIFIDGEAHHDGTLVTTATALFIDATEYMASLLAAE